MPVQVQNITFHHTDGSPGTNALSMRMNYATPVQLPEYVAGRAAQYPAAYACTPINAGGPVTILVTFTGGPAGQTIPIQALGTPGQYLGDVVSTPVTFDAAGNSAPVLMPLANTQFAANFIIKSTINWTWQANTGGGFATFGNTNHYIYIVIGVPQAPWSQAPGSTQLPWATALEYACQWAQGQTTIPAATAAITMGVNTAGPRYTPATIFLPFGYYDLTLYLFYLTNHTPFVMNCTDCANAVTSLANLVGANYVAGRFVDMLTAPILGIGGNPAALADWQVWAWAYHEICWVTYVPASPIYDAALRLQNAGNPNGDLPAPMTFLSAPPAAGDYHTRLVAAGAGNMNGAFGTRALI